MSPRLGLFMTSFLSLPAKLQLVVGSYLYNLSPMLAVRKYSLATSWIFQSGLTLLTIGVYATDMLSSIVTCVWSSIVLVSGLFNLFLSFLLFFRFFRFSDRKVCVSYVFATGP